MAGAIAGTAAFVLFAWRTPPVPGLGDAAEFTLALALAGVPHPTGYPLYVILGSAFVRTLHAAGVPLVTAAALWSGLGAAVAIGLMVALATRLWPGRVGPALWPAAILASNPVWLSAATTAEVYSWSCAWVAGAMRFVHARLEAHAEGRADPGRTALGWGLLCGTGFAHHLSTAFFALPLTVALVAGIARGRTWRWSLVPIAAAGAAVPLASYAFLLWRAWHPTAYQWPLGGTAPDLWRHATGAAYAFYMGGFDPSPLQRGMLATGIAPWMVPGLAGTALVALRFAAPAARGALLAALLGAALLGAAVFQYGVPDPAFLFLPVVMVGTLCATPAAAVVRARIGPALAAVAALAVLAGIGSVGLDASAREHARLARVDARIRAAWAAIPPGPAVVLWGDDHLHRLHVFQLLEGSRPELVLASPNGLTWPVAREAFLRRTGVDPLAGLEVRSREDVRRIPDAIRRRVALPVIDFPAILEGRVAAAR